MIRGIVSSVKLEEPLHGKNHDFIYEIFKMHSEAHIKGKAGIDHFFVRENKRYGGTTKGLWLKTPDGKEIDFSWVDALTPKTRRQKVMYAMRGAIQEQLYQKKRFHFKGNKFPRCELSGVPITFTNCDCHHIKPLYDIIVEFLNEDYVGLHIGSKGDWDAVHIDSKACEAQFGDYLTDKVFKKMWQSYHKEHASLVIIHRRKHQSFPKQAKYETENCRS